MRWATPHRLKVGGVVHYGHYDVYSKILMANLYGKCLLGSTIYLLSTKVRCCG